MKEFGYVVHWLSSGLTWYTTENNDPTNDLQKAWIMSLRKASEIVKNSDHTRIARVRRVEGKSREIPMGDVEVEELLSKVRIVCSCGDHGYYKIIPAESRWEIVDE